MTETATREEIQRLAKATLDGLFQFVDSEVLPLEEKFRDVLADERKLFRDDGLLMLFVCWGASQAISENSEMAPTRSNNFGLAWKIQADCVVCWL